MTKPTLAGLCAGALAVASFALIPGTAAGAVATPFEVTRSGDTYTAHNAGTGTTYTGTLVSVVESAVTYLDNGGGGRIQFAAGDFDLGAAWLDLHDVNDVEFAGAGMNATTIRNSTDVAQDTEPFDFSGAFGVTIRDLTVSAGGAFRSTSDALDFDNGNDVVVRNVKVIASRGRGIVFDGKNAGWNSANNHVVGCVITGVPSDGIELLASTDNVIEDCTITDVGNNVGIGGHGIQVAKSSPGAPQPNKLSSRNTIRNNTIDESGSDGINLVGGNANVITGNTITNSSDVKASRDGIRIETGDNVSCDDNEVRGNTATDNQATKTQRYGLAITSALCNRTVVGADNDFTGNRVGQILDQGTGTIYEGDPPPVNHPPVAGDLTITATAGTATTWTPVVSDPDPGTTLRCQLLQQPTKGTATVRTDCASGTYTSSAGATGSDTFVYRVSDGTLADTGTVSVTITSTVPTNRPPVAGDVSLTATAGVAKTWAPVVSDADGDTLTCSITTPPSKGTASLTSCASGSYTATAGQTGSDSFVYTVSDGKGGTDTGTVSVTIQAPAPTNQPPVARDVTITTPEGTAKTWTPQVSDPDAGATLKCTVTSPATKGTATVAEDCSSGGYTPTAGQTGADSFVYTVSDGKASDTGTVSVTVTPRPTDVTMLSPVADTFVKRTAPRSNFGSSALLRADKDPRARSYLRFRVPDLAGDVVSVTLRLYVGASNGGGMSVRGTSTAWRENRVTWNRSPEVGAKLAGLADTTPGGWHEISLPVSSVTGPGAVAWALTPNRGADLRIRSDESTKAPELVIVTK